MPIDGIKSALKILTKANKQTVLLIHALERDLGVPLDPSPLKEVIFDVGGKQYKGLLSDSQTTTVTTAGQSPAKVELALLNQISRVNIAQADALAGLQGALAAKKVKGVKPAATPPTQTLGSCEWTDGIGDHCQTNLTRAQCNAISVQATFVLAGGCPQLTRDPTGAGGRQKADR